MADNHIGSVLSVTGRAPPGLSQTVILHWPLLGGDLDPKTTALDEVMSEDLVTCDVNAGLDESLPYA